MILEFESHISMSRISSMDSTKTPCLCIPSPQLLVQLGSLLTNHPLFPQEAVILSASLCHHLQVLYLLLYLQIPLLLTSLHLFHLPPIVFCLASRLTLRSQIDYINYKCVCLIQEVLSINYPIFNRLFIHLITQYTALLRLGYPNLYLTLKFFLETFQFFVRIEALVVAGCLLLWMHLYHVQ